MPEIGFFFIYSLISIVFPFRMDNLFGQLGVLLRTQTGTRSVAVALVQNQIIQAVVACTWWVLIQVQVSQQTMNGLMDHVPFQQIH